VPIVQSVDLVGPNDEDQVTQPAETIPTSSSNTTPTTATSPTISKYGPISSRETLWSIASKLRPDSSVSVFQTLVAIYKANPDAFYQSNINRIIPRSVLTIPNKAFIAEQTNQEAEQLLSPNKPAAKITKSVVKEEAIKTEPVDPVITETNTANSDLDEDKTDEQSSEVVEADIIEQLKKETLDKAAALEAKNQLLAEQEKEFQLLSEQLIVATEANQSLKLKLQPLTDQVNSLAQQVEEDIATQKELKAIIDQYRQQIEAFVEPPFSGPGLLNEILRTMTASISSLLLTILAPLLFLIAVFLIFLRLKSKRELASREQEIAESTSILMEEDGQFDSLLTDDLDEAESNEESSSDIDFTEDAELAAAVPPEKERDQDENALTEDSDFDIVDSELINDNEAANDKEITDSNGLDDIEKESPAIASNDEFTQPETSEDDPFGIAGLMDDEDFDIDSLIDGKEEVIELSDVDLSLDADINQEDLDLAAEWETQLAEDADSARAEDIAPALADTEQSEVNTEKAKAEDISESVDEIDSLNDQQAEPANETVVESAESDEAAKEAITELAESPESDEAGKPEAASETVDDIDKLIDQEAEAAKEAITESAESPESDEAGAPEAASETVDDIDKLIDQEAEAAKEPITESAEPAVSDEAVTSEVENAVVDDIDELIDQEAEAEKEAITESAEPAVSDEAVTSEVENVVVDDVDELIDDDLSEFENVDLSTLKSVDQSISELDAAEEALTGAEQLNDPLDNDQTSDVSEQQVSEQLGDNESNILAEQLSKGAFDEDVELPTIDKSKQDEFIDIDTLLTSSGEDAINEEDFNLEFGLDEFPDVVESFAEFDSDDDGIAAQLDLARAYLEIDEKEGAKDILNKLLTTASDDKLKEVQKLLSRIK